VTSVYGAIVAGYGGVYGAVRRGSWAISYQTPNVHKFSNVTIPVCVKHTRCELNDRFHAGYVIISARLYLLLSARGIYPRCNDGREHFYRPWIDSRRNKKMYITLHGAQKLMKYSWIYVYGWWIASHTYQLPTLWMPLIFLTCPINLSAV
jgi:hypothetical protein